eukprot:4141648-Amphidinium_carterae.2
MEPPRFEPAIAAYTEMIAIRRKMGTLHSMDGAKLVHNVGICQGKRGDFLSALKSYAESKSICSAVGALGTPDGQHLLQNIQTTAECFQSLVRQQQGAQGLVAVSELLSQLNLDFVLQQK